MARRRTEAAGAENPLTATLPGWAREMAVLGCHGGAGTTTLRVLLDTPWELGAYAAERGEIDTFGRPLVLTCRNSVAATARAAEVLNVIERGGLRPAALVVMADGAGPEPAESAARLRLVRDRVGRLVRFPFVPSLRYVDAADADQVKLPAKARRALEDIRNACLRAATETLAQQGAG